MYCVECGCCSGELGKGWVAFRCDDPECDDRPEVANLAPGLRRRGVWLQA